MAASLTPEEIFPMEVWQMIFDKVTDPQDWLNLYRASPSFQGTMAKQRSVALLPQVLSLLLSRLDLNEIENPVGGILGLRLVSRKWRDAVDKELESAHRDDTHPLTFSCGLDFKYRVGQILLFRK